MKNKKIEVIAITIVLILQTLIYVFVGIKKSYIHMDEAYSLGLASYDKVEIQDNVDFYNTWHAKKYYEDYLSVQDDEKGEYKQVYENQKNDVHPPLYYLFLRFAMGFEKNGYSKWPGIIINIIVFMLITILTYFILLKILSNEEKSKEKSIFLSFFTAITMASLTNVIYIRMYAFSTLNIMLTTYLHMKLLECEKINPKLLICIGISALIGSLTHYYYLFYLAMMYIIFFVKYIKEKKWKEVGIYTITMVVAGITSLLIFPYSITHMFFGYRGQGVIDKFKNISMFFESIKEYSKKVNRFCFNNIGLYILIIDVILLIYKIITTKIIKRNSNSEKIFFINNKYFNIIIMPTLFYFLLVAVASPWIELRYIMPICSLIFIILIYISYKIIKSMFSEKIVNITMIAILIAIMLSPIFFKIEPEVMFSDKKEIVQKLSGELNLPTLYVFYSENNRFLDDILLFSKINESYIAKDTEYTNQNVADIFNRKNTENGIIIFINKDDGNEDILNKICDALKLNNVQHLKRMNACNIYLIK